MIPFLIIATTLFLSSVIAADEAFPSIPTTFYVAKTLSDDLKPIRREVYGEGKIFDITHRYTQDMPVRESSEGVKPFLRLTTSMKNQSLSNTSEMKLSVHTGTHLDAPGHFHDKYYDAGFDSDSLDLQILNGPALLVDVPRDKNITGEVMKSPHIPKGVPRVLFRILNTDRRLMFEKEFDSSFARFMMDGAKWLVENTDIKLIGLDYLSFAAYEEAPETHKFILGERVSILYISLLKIIPVEALKLDDVEVGMYSLHCLPLRLPGAEGAPTRCILIK
ncbi:PREDICTED: kynurenine formamidase-like [Brassica oleracea var. oleracea]|uniref:kynurenine formamidase-like n=1 Tax=Brassica oleracea var. oleracea TaxID=109376 RepID=UPI0006A71A70|nr:PREDICTED: kynurenine formamidase-like [Brassica oleracea var. oleracea]